VLVKKAENLPASPKGTALPNARMSSQGKESEAKYTVHFAKPFWRTARLMQLSRSNNSAHVGCEALLTVITTLLSEAFLCTPKS
jgi:hypothetical protein